MAAGRADPVAGSGTPTEGRSRGGAAGSAGAIPPGAGAQGPGGSARTQGAGDPADIARRRPADTGSYAAHAFSDASGDDTDTPTTRPGTDPLPRRVAGPPRTAGPGPRPGGPSQTGQFRTDQQARPPEQYRSVRGTAGFRPAPAQGGPIASSPGRVPPSSAAPNPADELFAPRVPSLDPNGQLPGHDPHADAFDLGETTPIFEEIASAWFRSNRPVPVSWESDTGSHPTVPQPSTESVPADTDPTGITRPGTPPPSDDRAGTAATGDGRGDPRSSVGTPADGGPGVGRPARGPADVLGDAGADTPPSTWPSPAAGRPDPSPAAGRPDPSPAPGRPDPSLAPPRGESRSTIPAAMPPGGPARPPFVRADAPAARVPEQAPADFSTAADEGWLAANGAVAERPDELTAAGLPKRRPRARLIPGSAGSAVLAPAVTAARSAENIRGRLASYQQGVRQGRETRLRGLGSDDPAPPAAPGADHDEESI